VLSIVHHHCSKYYFSSLVFKVSGAFGGLRASLFNTMSERIAQTLRNDVYSSMIRKDISFFDAHRTGELVSRLNSDTSVV